MNTPKRSFLPSPAMVVALIALISGLAGTAVALQGKNSVKSSDIAAKAVKSADIADKAVKGSKVAKDAINGSKIENGTITAPDLDVFRSATAPEGVSTASPTPVDLATGPSVTVTVPDGGLVEIYAHADILATGGGNDGAGHVNLFEATDLPDAPAIMSAPNGTGSFVTRYSAPGSSDFDGVASPSRGGMIVLAPPAGTYTFTLRYSATGGATATFQNRSLWAGVIS
jgi:hypothetical protein